MKSEILIVNGRVLDPAMQLDGVRHIAVSDGLITEISEQQFNRTRIDKAEKVIDATDCWVLPGLIDIHVHLREPGEEYKETIATGVKAAVVGGFTAVACMPNTKPVNDSAAVTEFILCKAKEANLAKVYPIGAVSKGQRGEELAEIGELVAAGCRAFSDDGHPILNSSLMRRALEYTRAFQVPIIAHEEDLTLAAKGVMNEGPISTRLGLRGIPSAAEESMVARDLSLAELTGGRLHLAHLSCAGSIRLVREAKHRGLNVTAEATPHHFTLTDEAVIGYNTNAKVNPPLRSLVDKEAVITGLADGTLDAIATDHAPHASMQKNVEFDAAANGLTGLETALPLTLDLVRAGKISPLQLAKLLSYGPARCLGLPGGSLVPGTSADIAIINPNQEWVCEPVRLHSKSFNTPFLGRNLRGRARYTLVEGRLVHSEK